MLPALKYTSILQMPTGHLAGRSSAGTGVLEALSIDSSLSLVAGVLSAAVASVAGRTGAVTLTKSDVGLSNVENTALSTWPGSTNVTTLGTISAGTWQGTAIASAYLNVTGDWSVNSHKITSVADPTNPQDAATKNYVDAAIQGLDVKTSVAAATTANIALSGTQTIDGVAVTAGKRVLVKNQSTPSQNGIYAVASGAWTRTTDGSQGELVSGSFAFVEGGTVNGSTSWVLTTADPITVGTTSLTFTQFAGAGTYSNGSGLTLTGTQFSIGAAQVTNAMLAGSIAASNLVGTDIATVGTITTGTWHGTKVGLLYGGTNADLSATGGASQFLKQASSGAAITVVQVADADLSVTDITTNNVSTTAHGFAPKAPNDATRYLDGTGAWSVPAGGGGGGTPGNPTASVGLAAVNGSASTYMRSDGAPALSQAIAPTWTGQHIFAQTTGTTTQPVKVLGKASQSVENWRSTLGTSQTGNHLSCYNSDDSTLALAVSSAGKITQYNALATAGNGVPSIVAYGSAVGVSSQQTSICTFTPAADGLFEVSFNVNITTLGSGSFTVQCTYTDENSGSNTISMIKSSVNGTVSSLNNAAGPSHGIPLTIRAKGGTAITIKNSSTTYTGCTYDVFAMIKQVAS
jgi:hypothetical protein